MNKFDEAEKLVKFNKVIESEAFEFGVGYSPMEDNLEPSEYAKYGFIKGQQELILKLIEKRMIHPYDLDKLIP